MTSFINSSPTSSQCPICKGWIYECHVNGFRTRVEPNPLNFQTEVAMRIEGRKIFQTLGISKPTLVARDLWRINSPRFGVQIDPEAKVFASHSCQTPEIFEPVPLFQTYKPPMSEEAPF